jgi:hypothetical protein
MEEEWVIVECEKEEFEFITKTSLAEPFWGNVVNK